MSTPHILFVDVNTLWHRRLAEALGEFTSVTAFLPRGGGFPQFATTSSERDGVVEFSTVTMPRGWASFTAAIGQSWLAGQILRKYGAANTVAVIATPAYRVLARRLRGRMPYVYYGADDYSGYKGWGRNTLKAEAEICRGAVLSVFVSESLRQRAITEYGLRPERTLTSPNGTEPRFAAPGDTVRPPILDGRARPVIGILGALTDRLDIDLVRCVAELDAVGTLLVAGPVGPDIAAREPWLRDNPKVVIAGSIPHEEMHSYALAMDAALIPYAPTPLNFHCSPLRLYDHLASGARIFATDTCDQISRCEASMVTFLPAKQLLKSIEDTINKGSPQRDLANLYWSDRACRLLEKIGAAQTAAQSQKEPA